MALKPITVNTAASEPAHILAEDDAAIYEALIGDDRVLNIGGKLAATVISNNKVRITDGVVVVGGHVARIYKGDYEDMTIENGVSGKNRNDLIVARFITGSDGGADSFKLVVIKGTVGTTASDPATVQGNLYNGDKQRDYPLWRVKIEGLSITKVEQLYEIGVTNADLSNSISQLNDNYIVEEGENDNGHYRKWSNGTLEMWGKLILNNVNINNRSNTSTTVYNSTQYRITFPFASLSECIVTCTNYSNTGAWVSMSTGGDRKSSFMFWLYAAGISNGNSHYICWRATGTWK